MSEHNSLPALLFMFVVAAGFVLGGGYLWVAQSGPIDNYEPVEATVISSDIDSTTEGGTQPDITYEYTVDGRTYTSSNVFPGPGDHSGGSAHRIVDEHPEGKQVTAYYNPEDPSEAFLIEDRSVLIPAMMIGIGGLVAVVAGWTIRERFRGTG